MNKSEALRYAAQVLKRQAETGMGHMYDSKTHSARWLTLQAEIMDRSKRPIELPEDEADNDGGGWKQAKLF